METNPTDLNEDQYGYSKYGVSSNGDLWLLYSSLTNDDIDECLWLGNDPDAWDNLLAEVGAEDCESTEITIEGEDYPTLICDMSIRSAQLDLDSLRNGYVIWYSAAE